MKTVSVQTQCFRILLVDDDECLLDAMRLLLQLEGHVVEAFQDSAEALVHFSAHPDQFDCVITDFNMPGLNGCQLCDAIRLVKDDIPIFMCSGQNLPTCMEKRLVYPFPKPVNLPALIGKLAEIMEP